VDYRELARLAYEALVNRTQNPKATAETRFVARRLVARESSGPLAAGSAKEKLKKKNLQ
jgi:DNA-binding LacI/PurR family transcriptional regulator